MPSAWRQHSQVSQTFFLCAAGHRPAPEPRAAWGADLRRSRLGGPPGPLPRGGVRRPSERGPSAAIASTAAAADGIMLPEPERLRRGPVAHR
jgi:hypothetical protein